MIGIIFGLMSNCSAMRYFSKQGDENSDGDMIGITSVNSKIIRMIAKSNGF